MAWIKRNLLFVVGLFVAGLLIGAGVFYLLQQMERAAAATSDLEDKNKKLETLVGNDPYPEKKNIELAKVEQVRLGKFQSEALTFFQTNQVPTDLDPERFQTLLLTTIVGLDREAESSGTKLPAMDYSFSFAPEKGNTQIPVKMLGQLAAQLGDIRAISRVLFRAKIHSLTSLKRTGTVTNDYGNADILTGKKPGTDPITGALIRPYEIQFQTFSSELGEVLAGFANAPETILVKAVNIQKGTLTTEVAAVPVASPLLGGFGGGRLDPALAARYGLNRAPTPQPVAAAPAASTKAGEIVVDESPIQVTLALEVVKLPAPGAVATAPVKPARPAAAQ